MAPRFGQRYDFEDFTVNLLDDEVDPQHYLSGDEDEDDKQDDGPEYIVINDSDCEVLVGHTGLPPLEEVCPQTFEKAFHQFAWGTVRQGDTVELVDKTGRTADHTLSGDFLRVTAIMEHTTTEEVTLKGFVLRRCTYLRPLFDGKINEVFMLIEANEDDRRPFMVQGLKTFPVADVVKKRNCQFTDVDYEAYDVRRANRWVPAGLKTSDEIKNYVFQDGILVCRWVHTVVFDHNSVSYSGEVRKLYRRETDQGSKTPSPSNLGPTLLDPSQDTVDSQSSQEKQKGPACDIVDLSDDPDHIHIPQGLKRRSSVEHLDSPPKRTSPTKYPRYTFGDTFCGVGGASEGAQQAGLHVKWGLELDRYAIEAYANNFPKALPIWENAHDFPGLAKRSEHGVDILHLSCPCQYWSEAHTNPGQNDQANLETLLTVGPIIKAIKPRYATLEQAPGLLKLKKHRLWFRKLINEIIVQKYNVRWTVTDQSIYGLPQRRRRLVLLCAKQGLPLPAFPPAVRGPLNSGLKPWVTVGHALSELERRAPVHDELHLPDFEKLLKYPKPPVDPFTILAKCITTSGGENVHPCGTRRFTPREFAMLQGFPSDYQFTEKKSIATKQAGNAWAPVANTKYFLLAAQFLEAFDLGLIDAEDEIDDLWDFLEEKGVRLDGRYLKKLVKSVKSAREHQRWGNTYKVEAAPRNSDKRVAPQMRASRDQRRVREEVEFARQRNEVIELD